VPKHTGLIDHDPERGITKLFHRLHDGDWVYETIQDTAPILDLNKWAQNEAAFNYGRQMKHVASIPLIVIEKWRNELGIDYWNPDHQGKVDDLLNSSEWRWLRTDNSVL
jgi:hypothetical protein